MKLIRYIVRLTAFFLTLSIGTIIALLLGWIPAGSNGARLAQKIAAQMARMALAIVDVKPLLIGRNCSNNILDLYFQITPATWTLL